MKTTLKAIVAVVAISLSAKAQTNWNVDASHSKLGFSVTHMMVSETEGKFKIYEGKVSSKSDIDFTDASIDFKIDVNSINTDDEKRDGHLKSPDFFDAAKFPEIKFVSKSFTAIDGQYRLTGDLTMKGVTKEVSFPVSVDGPVKNPMGGEAIGLSGQLTVNRQDYGVSFNKILDNGGVMVGNDVTVTINLEAHKS